MRKKHIFQIFAITVLIASLTALVISQWLPGPQEAPYRFVLAWGKPGSGPGEFNSPIGIAIAGDRVFVSDAGNHRIQVFDPVGNFQYSFGQQGDRPGELARPMHMAVKNEKLYVTEYLNDRVQLFSLDGKPLGTIGSPGSGPGQFDAPSGVAVDEEGRLYVSDFFNHRVQLLDADGSFIRQYGRTGKMGIRAGHFNYPTDVALATDDKLFVADAYNDRIQVFGSSGDFLHKWGGLFATDIPGSAPGWFRVATAVTVDRQGNVFVADFYNHRVQKFFLMVHFWSALAAIQGSSNCQQTWQWTKPRTCISLISGMSGSRNTPLQDKPLTNCPVEPDIVGHCPKNGELTIRPSSILLIAISPTWKPAHIHLC